MGVRKIISGGQTGADRGALEAAYYLGLETGGTAPWNWMTEEGPREDPLRVVFGLKEGPWDPRTYPKRTKLNIQDSHGTAIFGRTDTGGTRLTVRLCQSLNRPYICNPTSEELKYWIKENQILILNVAGNRESKNPGIQERVRKILEEALKENV